MDSTAPILSPLLPVTILLTDPIFTDANKAREHLESLYWPNGPVCRHCGNADHARITTLAGKSTRPGTLWCNECDTPFTVTVGTIMEDSHLPLNKWVLAFHLMASSKKGMSAHQLHRMLGVTYKTAWFLAHRIREAMTDLEPNKSGGPLGGAGKVVEADETVIGGKAKNRAYRDPAPKKMVATLVERGGRVRSKHVKAINSKTLRPFVMKNVSRKKHAEHGRGVVLCQDGPRIRQASRGRPLTQRVCLQA